MRCCAVGGAYPQLLRSDLTKSWRGTPLEGVSLLRWRWDFAFSEGNYMLIETVTLFNRIEGAGETSAQTTKGTAKTFPQVPV